MFVTAPVVARLTGRSRMTAHREVKSGVFGVPVKRGRADLVDLREVENFIGIRFSPQQLQAAGVHLQEDYHGIEPAAAEF